MKMIPEAEESTKAKTKPKINRREPNSVLSGFSKVDPIFIFGIVICVCLALMHAVSTCHYANFFPINGTFQNFNPVRRLLNGQIPYKDFVDYLGLGHVLVGGFMTAILGGHYQASLIAFSFLSFISLGLLSFAISLAILHTKRTAIAITDLIMVFLLVQSLQKFQFLNSLPGISAILGALNSSLGSGNSARFVRGLILPLTCLVVLGIQKVKSPPPNW